MADQSREAASDRKATNSAGMPIQAVGLAETVAQLPKPTMDIFDLKDTQVRLPKVTIEFCVQCKWGLRAAYYAQELLSTFCSTTSPSLSEVSLVPSGTGVFVIKIYHPTTTYPTRPASDPQAPLIRQVTTCLPNSPGTLVQTFFVSTLWDRKSDGGFPETKELKRRVRDVVEPGRNLGHVDRQCATEHDKPGEKEAKHVDMGGEEEKVVEVGKAKATVLSDEEKLVHAQGKEEGKQGLCEDCR